MSDPEQPKTIIEHEPEVQPPGTTRTREARPERVVRRGGTPVLLTLLLFAALGGGLYWVWTNPMPQPREPAGADQSQIATLGAQIQAASQGQAELKQAVQSQLQALSARVEALEKAPPPAAPQASSGDEAKQIADLGGRLEALATKEQSDAQTAQEALTKQQQKPAEPPPAAMSPEEAKKFDDLGTRLDALAAKEQSDVQAAQASAQSAVQAAAQAAAQVAQQRKPAEPQPAVMSPEETKQLSDLSSRLDALAGRQQADEQAASRVASDAQQRPDRAALTALAAAAHSDAQGQITALSQHNDEQLAQSAEKTLAEAKTVLDQQEQSERAARDALAQRVQKLEQGEGRVSGEAAKTALAIRVEQAAVALQAGQPVGDIPGAPPALSVYATTPPPTETALRGKFPRVADAIRAASRPEEEKTSFLDRALARVQQSVTVRRGDHVIVGDPAAGIVARAQEDVGNGDLAGAVHALSALQGPAAAAAADWVGQVNALLAARAALASLSAHG